MKKIISFILSLVLAAGVCMPAAATDEGEELQGSGQYDAGEKLAEADGNTAAGATGGQYAGNANGEAAAGEEVSAGGAEDGTGEEVTRDRESGGSCTGDGTGEGTGEETPREESKESAQEGNGSREGYTGVTYCGLDHVHTLACGSNPKAVETQAKWESTMYDIEFTGNWREDILAVAKSQLGYAPDGRNYIVTKAGGKRIYSRYGDWYGNTDSYIYGEYCAMFVSFCLYYSGMNDDKIIVPYNAGTQTWVYELQELGIYAAAGTYSPRPGDIVFFRDRLCQYDGAPAVHAGIVVSYDETSGELTTIEANNGPVGYHTYNLNNRNCTVTGFGVIPEQNCQTEKTVTAAAGDFTVTVTGALPDDAEIKLSPVSGEMMTGINARLYEDDGSSGKAVFAYDITIIDGEGNEWQPDGTAVTISISGPDVTADAKIIHIISGDGIPDAVTAAENAKNCGAPVCRYEAAENGKIEYDNVSAGIEGDTATFTAACFSPYVMYIADCSGDDREGRVQDERGHPSRDCVFGAIRLPV